MLPNRNGQCRDLDVMWARIEVHFRYVCSGARLLSCLQHDAATHSRMHHATVVGTMYAAGTYTQFVISRQASCSGNGIRSRFDADPASPTRLFHPSCSWVESSAVGSHSAALATQPHHLMYMTIRSAAVQGECRVAGVRAGGAGRGLPVPGVLGR